jgi:stage II sporulation protein AA (anti-sigma F factor antagonist)
MKYQVQENYLTIFLPGELDHHNAEEIRKESDHLIEHNHIRYVIFDFGRTNFMDSSGIGVIMGRYRHIFLLGGEVWAIHTSERMRQILNMSGVTKIIQIYEEGMM